MVAILNYMTLDEQHMAAPARQPENAIEAQKAALAAQVQAEEAQKKAIVMQAEEAGLPSVPPTAEERLRAASEAVQLADEKLIEHASK